MCAVERSSNNPQYPWYMVDFITIEDRNLIHDATKNLLQMLVDRVNHDRDPVNLTQMLLKRVCRAALRCPGFTPVMKDNIAYLGSIEDRVASEAGLPPFAPQWDIFWTIGPKPGVPTDLLLASPPLHRYNHGPANANIL
jgi:hypothetical protein